VLLSVADHHARSAARSVNRRVVGVLLGQDNGKTVNVANSFAVPFEEDEKDPKTWFLDHNYIEGMWAMFMKVNGASFLFLPPAIEYPDSSHWMLPCIQPFFLPFSSRTYDRVVPHWTKTTSLRPGD
jgi:hypothetical protein